MKDYILKNATYLKEGNTRKIYKLNDKVYKIASYPEYIENNKVEFQRYSALPAKLKKYVPEMKLLKDNYYEVLEVEFVQPLEDWLIQNNFMEECDFIDACVGGVDVDDLCESLKLDLYMPYELVAVMRELGSSEAEIYYPANYGVRGNTLVLLDFGDTYLVDSENFSLSKMESFSCTENMNEIECHSGSS